MKHKAEDGSACTEHVASPDALMTYAVIGSRVSAFNHDIASKLQGMMMALDEIEEMCERLGDPDLRRATETAQASLKDASALLSANRSLTRTSTKTKAQLADVVRAAGERVHVDVRGSIPEAQLETVVPLLVQGFALVIDAIAGAGRGRFVDVSVTCEGGRANLAIATTAEQTKPIGDALELAGFVIERAGGELRCARDRLHVQLPLAG